MFRRGSAAVPALLALAVIAYGGILRLDAFVQTYGPLDHPVWARVLTHEVAPLGASLRPAAYIWHRADRPYVGGDPINYLEYAREMRSFYQAHVREPIFLALTRGFLRLLSDQDAAVSFASMTGSLFTILATYLLGAALVSRPAGLAAAFVIAVDYDVISWSVEGWRDDVFTATVTLSAWAFVRCLQTPTRGRALVVGVVTAAACLTRVTALTFVLPAFVWLVFDGDAATWRPRAKAAATAVLVCTVLAAPYFISCAIATGDPFYAIDYHTGFYRYAEGAPSERPMSAAAYIRSKIAQKPVSTLDIAVTGMFVHPFAIKWRGLEAWAHGIGRALSWLAIVGLIVWLFLPDGRLLLVILCGSLLPYAFTWNVGGGGEYRFTMHAYPLYLVAALSAVALAGRGAIAVWREPGRLRTVNWTRRTVRVSAVVGVAAGAYALYVVLPWLVAREAIVSGADATIETGARDAIFFGAGWSDSYVDGLTFRLSRAEKANVRIPLPARRMYQVVLRLDPVAPDRQHRVVVLLNRQLVAALQLGWNPDRVGSYPVQLPAEKVRAGSNELTIVPDVLVPAASVALHVPAKQAGDNLGVRLWYVRVLGTVPAPVH